MGTSYWNELETEAIIAIYNDIKRKFPSFDKNKIGVISPYSKQVEMIRKKLSALEGSSSSPLEVNTVDGFQGREKDVIIFSTVRAPEKGKIEQMEEEKDENEGAIEIEKNKNEEPAEEKKKDKPSIGFLQDERRMNVSLSRARLVLIVVGNMNRLRISRKWRSLIKYAIKMKNAYNLTEPFDFTRVESNKDRFLIKGFKKLKKVISEENPKEAGEQKE